MRVFFYDSETGAAVPVECERFAYPATDALGRTIYENTHFRTEREAWEQAVRDTKAGVSLTTSSRRHARNAFERATVDVADAAERFMRAQNGLDALIRKEVGDG